MENNNESRNRPQDTRQDEVLRERGDAVNEGVCVDLTDYLRPVIQPILDEWKITISKH